MAAQVCSTPQSILLLVHYAGLWALSTASLAQGELGNEVQAMANHDIAHLNLNEPDTIEVYNQSMGGILTGLAKQEEVQYDQGSWQAQVTLN